MGCCKSSTNNDSNANESTRLLKKKYTDKEIIIFLKENTNYPVVKNDFMDDIFTRFCNLKKTKDPLFNLNKKLMNDFIENYKPLIINVSISTEYQNSFWS